MTNPSFLTEQENFWAGSFGVEYIQRNDSPQDVAIALVNFAKALSCRKKIASIMEFGANIGMNLYALNCLLPDLSQHAIEINPVAAAELRRKFPKLNVMNESILEFDPQPYEASVDLALISGVLIHINPDFLQQVYEKLYKVTKRYILISEYYNPTPVEVSYRGHSGRLFKRDFAAEILVKYPDLQLLDYGFSYRGDLNFPADDVTWFLLEKRC